MLACSNDNVAGSFENSNEEKIQSSCSSIELLSSSEEKLSSSSVEMSLESSSSSSFSSSSATPILCKASGGRGCVVWGDGDLWSFGNHFANTKVYTKDSSKYGNRTGELFFETDSIEGGGTYVEWNDGRMVTRFGTGYLSTNVFLDKGSMDKDPYFNVGFNIAGFDSNGVALSADITDWYGICTVWGRGSLSKSTELFLQLDLGDSINQKIGYALPSVSMSLSKKNEPECYEWKQFMQPQINKEHEIISGEDAAKHVVRIIYHFQSSAPQDTLVFEILAIGTNRNE